MLERCDRLGDVDLAAYLENPARAHWSDLHKHAESCVECASALRAWRLIHEDLKDPTSDDHPDVERLVAYADARGTLAADEVAGIENHLKSCVTCRDEVGVLGSLRIEPLQAAKAPAGARKVFSLEELLSALRGFLWHPAFAYAVALICVLRVLPEVVLPGAQRLERDAFDLNAPFAAEPRGSSAPRALGESKDSLTRGIRPDARRAQAFAEKGPASMIRYAPAGRSVVRPSGAAEPEIVVVMSSRATADEAVLVPSTLTEIEIRVVTGDGRRDMRTIVPAVPEDGSDRRVARMSVPSSWLTPGAYQIELRAAGQTAPIAAPLSLDVLGATGDPDE